MHSLKEILDNNSEVLLDTSVNESSNFKWDVKYVDNLHLYSYHLEKDLEGVDVFLGNLRHKNARTTFEVTREISKYAYKLKKIHEECRYKDRAFKLLKERFFQCVETSRQIEININDQRYKCLTEMVVSIERFLYLKKDLGYIKGYIDTNRSHSSDTDEKLVSILFYRSMFSKNPPVLATRDGDFIRLLDYIPRIIGSDDFLPHNKFFRDRINRNQFKLYYKNSSLEYSLCINRQFYFLDDLRKFKEKNLFELRDKIASLWKRLIEQL